MTGPLTPEALDAMERERTCARRSGIEDRATDSLLATVRGLQRELLTQVQRTAEAMQSDAAAMERMCERVTALEGHLRAVIDERLADNVRGPQPALSAALAYLKPGHRREYVVAAVEQLGGGS